MPRKTDLIAKLEKAYEDAKGQECEELHNAIVAAIQELAPSPQNALFVLDLIRFELMSSQYKILIEKTVKLDASGLTPVSKPEEKPKG